MTRRASRIFLPAAAATAVVASALLTGVAQGLPLLDEPDADAAATSAAPGNGPGWPGRIVTLTNDERARVGCEALTVDDRLVAAAQAHAEDMAARNEMSHVGNDGSTFDERMSAAGYPEPGAENIARGYPDPETTMREWMASPGHRENIVDCDYATIGVGFDPHGNFVAQDFGRPE